MLQRRQPDTCLSHPRPLQLAPNNLPAWCRLHCRWVEPFLPLILRGRPSKVRMPLILINLSTIAAAHPCPSPQRGTPPSYDPAGAHHHRAAQPTVTAPTELRPKFKRTIINP